MFTLLADVPRLAQEPLGAPKILFLEAPLYLPSLSSTCFPLRDNEQRKIPGLQKPLELDSLLHLIRELVA